MAGDVARARDPEFPNLPPDVVEAYRSAPADVVAEIMDGGLSLMPRPRPRHARVAVRLVGELRPFDNPRGNDPGGWIMLIEPELRLGPLPDLVVPDLVGWKRDRLPESVFTDDTSARIAIAPDWVCEVLSERTAATDRGRKMRIYRREPVGHYWLVDPVLKTLEVYRLVDGQWLVVDTWEGDVKVRAEPFDTVELDLALLWSR